MTYEYPGLILIKQLFNINSQLEALFPIFICAVFVIFNTNLFALSQLFSAQRSLVTSSLCRFNAVRLVSSANSRISKIYIHGAYHLCIGEREEDEE